MDELTDYLASTGDDEFWDQIQLECRDEAEREPMLASYLFAMVLRHENWKTASACSWPANCRAGVVGCIVTRRDR